MQIPFDKANFSCNSVQLVLQKYNIADFNNEIYERYFLSRPKNMHFVLDWLTFHAKSHFDIKDALFDAIEQVLKNEGIVKYKSSEVTLGDIIADYKLECKMENEKFPVSYVHFCNWIQREFPEQADYIHPIWDQILGHAVS